MGRRKIEIKAIKDDRNRSVTFLKRKGGLFKKAHELSVLCSVDVAVFVFGNNKKLYEYSSNDMRDLIARYQFHGGPNEHKGPADFNGGNDDDDDEEADGSPPQTSENLDQSRMVNASYHAQGPQVPFPQMRNHTASASPPIPNGAVFPGHPHHQRGHTPQGSISRPLSRNDGRRATPSMMAQGPPGGMTYMPTPPIYNQQQNQQHQHQQHLMPQHAPAAPHHYTYPPQQQPQQQAPQAYMEERRPSAPPMYTQPPPQAVAARADPSPPQPQHQAVPQVPTKSPQPSVRPHDPQPPPPVRPKTESQERPQPPLLNTDSAIRKLPQRKGHSIFTPVEENRSMLSQHLAAFAPESIKTENGLATVPTGRPHSTDMTSSARTVSPPQSKGRASVGPVPETTFTPPSRSNSFQTNGSAGGQRPRGPRLTVQIPDEGSEPGSATESTSPKAETRPGQQRQNSNSSIVLPAPSPSAGPGLLSAGATGPPNPFAKPLPQQNINAETPASALPSHFISNNFLPSPSSFYNDWNFRASDSNTLPSPLNFATPVGPSGPSFLRDDNSNTAAGANKRKSPELAENEGCEGTDVAGEAKRIKVE